MKKLLIGLVAVVALCFGGSYAYEGARLRYYRHRSEILMKGYSVGYIDGHREGVFNCPCWEREGNICSLCQTRLEGTGLFKRIK